MIIGCSTTCPIGDVKNTESLFRYQEDAVQKDILRKADESIEALMLFLEANAAGFPTYKNSAEFAQNFTYLVSSPTALHRALPEVSKSYRMYNVLRGYMDRAERATAKTITGGALFDVLKTKVRSGDNLDSNFKKLLELCQEYIAPAALLEAMPWIRVQFSPAGVRIASVLNNLQDETPINDDQTKWLMGILEDRVAQSKTALRIYLNGAASLEVFPEYFLSELYRAPGSRQWSMPDNASKKTFQAMKKVSIPELGLEGQLVSSYADLKNKDLPKVVRLAYLRPKIGTQKSGSCASSLQRRQRSGSSWKSRKTTINFGGYCNQWTGS